ncbi:nucleotidyltransferase substrate binding protein [Acetobacter cerevisiae]|uniref:Nucleotidyltransferase n=2 Tax=Acetobacter TaxID=434 RepID=A0A149UR07_9PROT|nr:MULTISPECIES: nucleotidyltransferase substrate binding protein [Acetobacter]KXV70274.1 nucleotidyltransferase [Acetobacter cerevisiae]KXV79340.1 nucleotidyltransferase [Acetobacter malorum]MCP1247201.1 nucleotidyltransferase substrate binding protein [Acetobacter cerevisiae]MCP1256761.1 nucleotidyltransferase substrate binding protein [Acetobacter cerevisiae]
MLYLTPLERALDRLKEGWTRHLAQPDDEQLRDGLIQRFEFTYELSHKTLKRFLEANSASPEEYDRMGFPDMIRSANEAGLLRSAWPQWSVFRKMRNLTSHTYNEATAKQVVATIPDFIAESEFLLATLKERTT